RRYQLHIFFLPRSLWPLSSLLAVLVFLSLDSRREVVCGFRMFGFVDTAGLFLVAHTPAHGLECEGDHCGDDCGEHQGDDCDDDLDDELLVIATVEQSCLGAEEAEGD